MTTSVSGFKDRFTEPVKSLYYRDPCRFRKRLALSAAHNNLVNLMQDQVIGLIRRPCDLPHWIHHVTPGVFLSGFPDP